MRRHTCSFTLDLVSFFDIGLRDAIYRYAPLAWLSRYAQYAPACRPMRRRRIRPLGRPLCARPPICAHTRAVFLFQNTAPPRMKPSFARPMLCASNFFNFYGKESLHFFFFFYDAVDLWLIIKAVDRGNNLFF